ncbi:hypothetical protein JYU34_013429 [Plutella xylostella]|uniref:FP protein C-terminal domain-containing protein n=1 Tax=Plutella xylostella TaxID=51655 RepID=A0ABQ7Q9S3_PLUXY|nr:hypothetical protein JYU34_013429 [Plutella xylostella]
MPPTNNYGKCAGCRNNIPNKEFINCSICGHRYDLQCANVSEKLFVLMELEHKRKWKCQECLSRRPKGDNSNTPARAVAASVCESPSATSNIATTNVTTRTKRNPTSSTTNTSPDVENYVTETMLRDILKQELTGTFKQTIKEVVAVDLKAINDLISGFRDSLSFFNEQFESMRSLLSEKNDTIKQLEADNTKLNSTVKDLSGRLHLVEQHMRENNIEINGIPENRSENLVECFNQLAVVVDNPLKKEDIVNVTRVAKINKDSAQPRAIIVKLCKKEDRDSVLAAVSTFNKKNPKDKLNSRQLGYEGPQKPVFVSEHLTPTNKSLHAAARIKAREVGYKFVWFKNGRIYVKKDETSQRYTIHNLDSLKNIV